MPVTPPPGNLTFVAPAGFTIHRARRLDEVYVEAAARQAGSGRLNEVYAETESVQAATAHLDQAYVEVWTHVQWRGWGIRT